MRGDCRQNFHLHFDLCYTISLLCSSFRYGLSFLYKSENFNSVKLVDLNLLKFNSIKLNSVKFNSVKIHFAQIQLAQIQLAQIQFVQIQFAQIQFAQIQFDHRLACGFVDSLHERSLGIISNMANACECIRKYVLDIERWLESGNHDWTASTI